ncbi:hypothetical protein BDQ17DRAFT_1041976 [Cyathus striatus]|nr:hypothetical protein BDQ17DRAFT_1041976 [Cyathus striatus]
MNRLYILYFFLSLSMPHCPQQYLHIVTNYRLQPLKRVLLIDISAIMEGSGIRCRFKNKFKALIKEINDEC